MAEKASLSRVRQLIAESASKAGTSGRRQIEAVTIHTNGFAEPGYEDPEGGVVCLGNWNAITYCNEKTQRFVTIDATPEDLSHKLMELGVQIEWSDEWVACNRCGKLVRTTGDCYGWTPQYWGSDEGEVCCECIRKDPSDYLLSLEGHHERAITIDDIDLSQHGYKLVDDDLENGLSGGQADSPSKIAEALKSQVIDRFVFQIDSCGQFDTNFSVWVHESEWDRLDHKIYEQADKQGEDPAEQTKQYLQDAALKIRQNKKGITVVQPDSQDPSKARAKTISPQDFVNGKVFD
jgi:hypothetical protein